MIPGFPLTLGFTPDDALIDFLAEEVKRRRFDTAIARSVIRQLLYALHEDFMRRALNEFLAETTEQDIFTACYASYRPKHCRCTRADRIYFQVTFYSKNLSDFTVVDIELANASLLDYMPARPFYPTPEERRLSHT